MFFDKKITKQDVKRIMELAPQNNQEMITLAKEFGKLTSSEKIKSSRYSKKNKPQAKIDEIIKESKTPYIEEKIIIPLSPALLSATDKAAKTIGLDRVEYFKSIRRLVK